MIASGSQLTRRDLMEALPIGDEVVVLELDGATLRQTLEFGVGTAKRLAGRFIQVSGIEFTWNRTAASGARMRAVSVGSAPLDPAQPTASPPGPISPEAVAGFEVASVLMDYIASLGTVAPRIEGRIREEH